MTADQIKVAIADDHKIFRDGIKMALKDKEYLRILWEAEDGKDLMHKLKIKIPDVVLMDIRMPEVDGINAISMIRKEYEGLKIIVLTMYDDQEMITNILKHSNSSFIHLTQNVHGDKFYLRIHHDGRGIIQSDFEKLNKSNIGLGLKNIGSRIRLLQGEILFEKDISQTYYKVTIEVPKDDPYSS